MIWNALQSPEFWKAAVGFASAIGVTLDQSQANAIVALALAAMGAINAFKHVSGK